MESVHALYSLRNNDKGRGSAASSVNQELSALRRMFRAAAVAGFVDREKAEDAARVENTRAFSLLSPPAPKQDAVHIALTLLPHFVSPQVVESVEPED